MNKSQLKTYAPKARRDFIQMIRQRADVLGLTKGVIEPVRVEGEVAIIEGRPYPRRYAELHTKLAKMIAREGLERFLDHIAYSWFNRFAALRFMEVNGYLSHPFRVLSNRDGPKGEPEILEHAAEVTLAGLDKNKVIELKLAGNKDAELYKMLLIAQCNELHAAMPFLFERINDESEILLSDNLLHTDSVIRKMVSEIHEENWKQVEIIGWLYQFYISEKKDEVIGKTVKSEDIPAATQLFTPNWIVKYMTQNSLGRLWLDANPHSDLKAKAPMEFYIEPAKQNESAIRDPQSAIDPEHLRILDPACGSGHILVEAYDLLKAIYTERGYSSRDIPRLILEKNLFGLDIDERAAQLSNFALLMRARGDDPRIFEQNAIPSILTIPDSSTLEYKPSDIAEMFLHGGTDIEPLPIRDSILLFTEMETQPSLTIPNSPPYRGGVAAASADGMVLSQRPNNITETQITDLLDLFAQGKTLGSLIRIPDGFEKVIDSIEASIAAKFASSDMMEQIAARQLVPFVRAAKMLARKYDCVIANPPYMGGKYYNPALKTFVNKNYSAGKGDLYACFTIRNLEMCKDQGRIALLTIPNWMFLSTFEPLRNLLLDEAHIETFVHNGRGVFGSDFGSCAFTIAKEPKTNSDGAFKRLFEIQGSVASNDELERRFLESGVFLASSEDFKKVPGSPIAYWVSDKMRAVFEKGILFENVTDARQGLATSDNNQFIRLWWEVGLEQIGFNLSSKLEAEESGLKWFP